MISKFVFIPGLPRCGSTWITRWLSEHPDIIAVHESNLITSAYALMLDMQKWSSPSTIIPNITEFISKTYNDYAMRKSIFIDKSPGDFYDKNDICNIDKIRIFFPKAHIIICYKDAKDIAYSMKNLPWKSKLEWNASQIIARWNGFVRFYKANPETRHLIYLRYEDLLGHPETCQKICNFLEINHYDIRPWLSPTNTLTRIYKKDRWKALPKSFLQELEPLNEGLKLLSYECL